jgi:hypothetical protein
MQNSSMGVGVRICKNKNDILKFQVITKNICTYNRIVASV